MSIQETTLETIVLGMGCFWGAEKRMSALEGVLSVESGYANGEVSGEVSGEYRAILAHEEALRQGQVTERNHAEVVKVSFDPRKIDLETVLALFWESHDPTQGDRQGNDVGSNYRSAIYTGNEAQLAIALKTRDIYQAALTKAGYGAITTEIEPLKTYFTAEEYHQRYLEKNPDGYCGLGGTGVPYPVEPELNFERQLIAFVANNCMFSQIFDKEVLRRWKSEVPIRAIQGTEVPAGWKIGKALSVTPTIVLFEKGREVSRFMAYDGDQLPFWRWLGAYLLTPEQQKIAFEQGTEQPGTGCYLNEKRAGVFVDPITCAPLFRSDTKFESSSGWPSFFTPLAGALTEHIDTSYGMQRVEVRSASSGIHLGHVFNDGPPPTHKRYCINGNVLKFIPDQQRQPYSYGKTIIKRP